MKLNYSHHWKHVVMFVHKKNILFGLIHDNLDGQQAVRMRASRHTSFRPIPF
jgi:hypothetical protein